MKKLICAVCALALTLTVFAGCDKSRMKDSATTRPATTRPAAESTTTLGERIESGLTDASERLSEGVSDANETLSRAAERIVP